MRTSRVIFVTALFLSACSWGNSGGPLPPDEVLQQAARASQSLDSADYVVNGRYTYNGQDEQTSAGDIHMQGTVSHGGEQLQFVLTLVGDMAQSGQNSTVNGTLEVIVAGQENVYMNLHSLAIQPSNQIFRPELIGQFAGKWWLLPSQQGVGAETTGVSPDPRVLQAQSQVVRVVKDNGLESLNGRQAYFYQVELDKEKLYSYLETLAQERNEPFDGPETQSMLQSVSGEGELWIDAETFQLHKVQWDITTIPVNLVGTVNFSFTADFTNHNSAAPIQLPSDAQVITPAAFLGVPTQELPDQALPGVPAELEQQMIDDLLRSMQSQ